MNDAQEVLTTLKKNYPHLMFSQPLLDQLDSISAINFIIQAETILNRKINLMRFDMKEVAIESALIAALEESHQ